MAIASSSIANLLRKKFSHSPTSDQEKAFLAIAHFLNITDERPVFILKGYAGTGKTSMVTALVNALPSLKMKTVLMAPTGRAAKVLAGFAHKRADTIHRRIYFARTAKDGHIVLQLQRNLHENTVYLIDEASMIPDDIKQDDNLFSKRSLLDDLLTYVFEGKNNRVVFIGDKAQLPPVGISISPALDKKALSDHYDCSVSEFELTEVVRQSAKSDLLTMATFLRDKLEKESYDPPFFTLPGRGSDVEKISPYELPETLSASVYESGIPNTVVITRSNKRANQYNQLIRQRLLFREFEIEPGDQLMAVKNNYFWLPPDSQAGFIANGDIIELSRVQKIEEKFGFRFADVTVFFPDYPDEPELELKIILDTLSAESPALSREDNKKLFDAVIASYENVSGRLQKMSKVLSDPFFNALQVKFAYALTCHKTQGGQWEKVFIDQGWITPDMFNADFLRWLYTAFTRSTKKVFLVGFDGKFFNE